MPNCPDCDGPLVKDGTYCRSCGWDGELDQDEYLDGLDLPGTDLPEDFDYDEALRRDGIGAAAGGPVPLWLLALGFVAAVALLLLLLAQ